MKKVIQTIRISSIIIGCSIIFFGVWWNWFSYTNLSLPKINHYQAVVSLIYGMVSSFFQGTVIILLALIMNPDKVAPLLDKKGATNGKEETIGNKDK